MVELECRSLRVVLFLEEAFKAATIVNCLRTATGMSCLPQNGVEVRVSLRQLWVTLLHMLMCWEILTCKVWTHVIKLSPGSLSTHCKPVLKGISADASVDGMSSLEWHRLICFSHFLIIAARRWSGVVILLHEAPCNRPWNACNLRFVIFIELALGRFPIDERIINGYSLNNLC